MIQTLLGVSSSLSALLAALMLAKPAQTKADRWLAAWFGAFAGAMLLFLAAFHATGPAAVASSALANSCIAACAPALYLYARAISGRPATMPWAHFFVAGANIILMAALYAGGVLRAEHGAIVAETTLGAAVVIIPPLMHAASMVHCVLAVRAIDVRVRQAKQVTADRANVRDLVWVRRWSLGSIAFYVSCGALFFTTGYGAGAVEWHVTATLAAACALVVFVGYSGLQKTRYFRPDAPTPAPPIATAPAPTLADADVLLAAIAESGAHLEPRLTLAELSEQIGWPADRIRLVVETAIQETFFEVINRMRVAHAKRLIDDPANADVTLLALGFDSGFGSKSAFNEAFRRHAGMTPSQYRRRKASS